MPAQILDEKTQKSIVDYSKLKNELFYYRDGRYGEVVGRDRHEPESYVWMRIFDANGQRILDKYSGWQRTEKQSTSNVRAQLEERERLATRILETGWSGSSEELQSAARRACRLLVIGSNEVDAVHSSLVSIDLKHTVRNEVFVAQRTKAVLRAS